MYYKQALKPNELLPALSDSGECFLSFEQHYPSGIIKLPFTGTMMSIFIAR